LLPFYNTYGPKSCVRLYIASFIKKNDIEHERDPAFSSSTNGSNTFTNYIFWIKGIRYPKIPKDSLILIGDLPKMVLFLWVNYSGGLIIMGDLLKMVIFLWVTYLRFEMFWKFNHLERWPSSWFRNDLDVGSSLRYHNCKVESETSWWKG
jgi:hypothetical protein